MKLSTRTGLLVICTVLGSAVQLEATHLSGRVQQDQQGWAKEDYPEGIQQDVDRQGWAKEDYPEGIQQDVDRQGLPQYWRQPSTLGISQDWWQPQTDYEPRPRPYLRPNQPNGDYNDKAQLLQNYWRRRLFQNAELQQNAECTCKEEIQSAKDQIDLIEMILRRLLCEKKDIDQCDAGVHKCDQNANCTATPGSYTCTCRDGFQGDGFVCTRAVVDCGALNDPNNGDVSLTGTTFGSTATYSCSVGYVLEGEQTRTCQATGEWSGTAPHCRLVDCGDLDNPDNGQVSQTGTTFGSTATYNCGDGYELDGEKTRTCQANEKWSGTAPRCRRAVVDCGALNDPSNGDVSLTGTTFGSTATYSCSVGYVLEGEQTRTCQATGEWSGTVPRCRRIPDRADNLISVLGLGSKGMDYRQIDDNANTRPLLQQTACRTPDCSAYEEEIVGKRAIRRERMARSSSNPEPSDTVAGSEEVPLPFEWEQHHHRFRRQSSCSDPSRIMYMAFVLDESGSIGETNFKNMTKALGRLFRYFCRKTKIAVLTFNHHFTTEICFDCFDNTCSQRLAAAEKVKAITYNKGRTHTGGATECVCNEILSMNCGYDANSRRNKFISCTSVIYITDGKSTDPTKKVCDKVQCLRNRDNFDTYAIGIGQIDNNELNCIKSSPSNSSVFQYDNFDDFIGELDKIQTRLENEEQDYECANPIDPNAPGNDKCIT